MQLEAMESMRDDTEGVREKYGKEENEVFAYTFFFLDAEQTGV